MTSPVCHWVRGLLSAYLDGELKGTAREAVRQHLERCDSCRARLRLLEETDELLEESPRPPVRAGFTSRMMARVVEEKELERLEARRRPHRLRRTALATVGGLAAGLLVGLGLFSWTGIPAEPRSPIERQVSRHLTFLDDAELMDEVALIEAIEQIVRDRAPGEGA